MVSGDVPEVMDVAAACSYLGVHRNTLSELMHREDDPIPFKRVGRKYGVRFLKRAVDAWLAGETEQEGPRLRRVG